MADIVFRENTKLADSVAGDGLGPKLTPLTYGAVGDGSTDDRAAFQSFLSACTTLGRGGFIPRKTYKLNSGLSLSNVAGLRLEFEPGALLDFRGASDSATMLSISGTQSTESLLTANAAKWATTVTVASGASFAVGDPVYLLSDKTWSAVQASSYGEFNYIVGKSGNVLTLMEPCRYAYATGNTAKLIKLQPVRGIVIDGLRAIGSGTPASSTDTGQWGLHFTCCEDVHLTKCDFDAFQNRAVQFNRCWSSSATKVAAKRSDRDGLGYGIAIINGSHGVQVGDSNFYGCRHGVTVGGGSGVNRSIRIHDSTAMGCTDAGFDCHPQGDGVAIEDCAVEGGGSLQDGIVMQGANGKVAGNTVTGVTRHGILGQPAPASGELSTIQIIDNIVRYPTTGNTAIFLANRGAGLLASVDIHGNECIGGWTTGILVQAADGSMEHVKVNGNSVRVASGKGIRLQATTGRSIQTITVNSNTVEAGAENILLDGADTASVINGTVTGNTTIGGTYGVRGTNDNRINVQGNTIRNASSAATSLAGAQSTAANNITS